MKDRDFQAEMAMERQAENAEEFNLSKNTYPGYWPEGEHIHVKDVKEFIKRFKEEIWSGMSLKMIRNMIDKLAGEKLI